MLIFGGTSFQKFPDFGSNGDCSTPTSDAKVQNIRALLWILQDTDGRSVGSGLIFVFFGDIAGEHRISICISCFDWS